MLCNLNTFPYEPHFLRSVQPVRLSAAADVKQNSSSSAGPTRPAAKMTVQWHSTLSEPTFPPSPAWPAQKFLPQLLCLSVLMHMSCAWTALLLSVCQD